MPPPAPPSGFRPKPPKLVPLLPERSECREVLLAEWGAPVGEEKRAHFGGEAPVGRGLSPLKLYNFPTPTETFTRAGMSETPTRPPPPPEGSSSQGLLLVATPAAVGGGGRGSQN